MIFAFASLLHSDKQAVKTILKQAAHSLNPNGIFFISLKCDEYREYLEEGPFGIRTFYFYTPDLITELAGDNYTLLKTEYQEINGQKWFSCILQKA